MPGLITDDQMREIREALGDQVPAIWMHRNAWAWLAALSDEVEQLRDGIAELERQLDADAKHAALGPDECCDVCTHRQAEDLIAEVDRLEAASAHEREITDKAIARAEKAESALERVRRLANLARYKGPEPADIHAAVLDSLARELLAALDGE